MTTQPWKKKNIKRKLFIGKDLPKLKQNSLTINRFSLIALLNASAIATRPRWSEYKIRAWEPTTYKQIKLIKHCNDSTDSIIYNINT